MTTVSNSSDGAGNNLGTGKARQNHTAARVLELERLPLREPPLGSAPHRIHGKATRQGQPRLVIFPKAAEQISAHATSNLQSEVGGVLLGMAYRSESDLWIDVQAALPVQSSDHGPIHFTFNADAWSRVHRHRAERYPDLSIVGWFHTHPGLGIFFSGDDVIVHSAAFVLPWHTALVIDPLQGAMGAFAWHNGELATLPGFYEILDSEETNGTLPWKMRSGEIWTESYLQRMATQPRAADAGDRKAWQQVHPLTGVLLGIAGILLSLGLLFGAILPLGSQNEALQEVVGAMAERAIVDASASGAATCPSPALRIYAPLPDTEVPYGDEITLVGVADVPDAASYRLDVRPAGEQSWWSLGDTGRSVNGRAFLTWDTSSFAPGIYQLRLAALDGDGNHLASTPACTIRFTLSASAP